MAEIKPKVESMADVKPEAETMTEIKQEEIKPDEIKPEEEVKLEEIKPEKVTADDLNSDEYSYLKNGFSSELFRLELTNLPKFFGVTDIKKLMKSHGLDCNKIKKLPHLKSCCFVNFRNAEDQHAALKIFNEFKFKNKVLTARIAKPSKDPLARKRKNETECDRAAKKAKRRGENTQPLGHLSYEEQLKLKQKQVEDIIEEFKRELKKANENQMQINIDLLPIVPSPQDIGYRNKVEFTVGWDANKDISVGNRTGSYSQGDLEVEKAENLKIAPEKMKNAAKHFEEFVKNSKWEPFNAETSQGNWKQLTTRLNNDELMLIVGVNPQNLTPDDIQEIQDEIVKFFTSDERKELNVKSIYYEDLSKRQPGQKCNLIKHIYGDTHIHEYLLGLCFRISPTSFFQVNTKAAEKLYQEIINFAAAKPESTVLDVCCGTGTIGLSMAKHCKQVLGMEIIPEAIEDANINAKENKIENAKFTVGSAEEHIFPLVKNANLADQDDVIAIVDPPRSGLGMKAILQLRNTTKIKKIVYVSCSPKQAMKNLVDLAKKPSKVLRGPPFIPKLAISVDMFPYTSHFELVIVFER